MTNIPITTGITDATPEKQIHREMRKARVLLMFLLAEEWSFSKCRERGGAYGIGKNFAKGFSAVWGFCSGRLRSRH
jgi:hypothetical protein